MPDPTHLIQEKFVTKGENPSAEYQRLLNAYVENPFDDMHLRPEEKKKLAEATPESTVPAV
ncbi:MAG: hypothetical protein HY422_00920 [Candidatus Komeilibacteria bacterium]|nr:hypothetical protein [Candidatus Komeilibacteria bacterium]